jgi:hypothetical protein
MLIIQQSGRFGNNTLQFIHAILIAEHLNIPIIQYTFPQYKGNKLKLKLKEGSYVNSTNYSDTFLQIEKYYPYLSISFTQKQQIAVTYLLPILKYSKEPTSLESYYTSCLFIHIRSGDIFDTTHQVHPEYAQPPLDFYKKIIEREQKQVLLIYEDRNNPVVDALSSTYPTIKMYSFDLPTTITIFMNAQHIVCSNGTFISSILYFNRTIKTVYSTVQLVPERTHVVSLPNYITEWNHTKEQREFMLSYKEASFIE